LGGKTERKDEAGGGEKGRERVPIASKKVAGQTAARHESPKRGILYGSESLCITWPHKIDGGEKNEGGGRKRSAMIEDYLGILLKIPLRLRTLMKGGGGERVCLSLERIVDRA